MRKYNLDIYRKEKRIMSLITEGASPIAKTFFVGEIEKIRLDKWLQCNLKGVSRSSIQKSIKNNKVYVNGFLKNCNYLVKKGDKIIFSLLLPPPSNLLPEFIPFSIYFEDDQLMVIEKPAHLVVHPACGNWSGTLANGLIHYYSQLPVSTNKFRPGIVHRLDKGTSGLMVIAKNERCFTFLSEQFAKKKVKKGYHALVWGNVIPDQQKIDIPLGRCRNNRKIIIPYPPKRGKDSVTHVSTLERLNLVTLIRCIPETGRTHQIRSHCRAIGHPIFGDNLYGGRKIRTGIISKYYRAFVRNGLEIMKFQALHASSLSFQHPNKKQLSFESPLPPPMVKLLQRWQDWHSRLSSQLTRFD